METTNILPSSTFQMIAAVETRTGGIGNLGSLAWTIPADLSHFKDVTRGAVVIMGRGTWDSLGKLLPNRIHIVLSRSYIHRIADRMWTVPTLDLALDISRKRYPQKRIWVIGGEKLYTACIDDPRCVGLHITEVWCPSNVSFDRFFPVEKMSSNFSCIDASPLFTHASYTFRFLQYCPTRWREYYTSIRPSISERVEKLPPFVQFSRHNRGERNHCKNRTGIVHSRVCGTLFTRK